ncbi:MAG: hypothetical protein WC865_10320 [Bacteroidales bacterium]
MKTKIILLLLLLGFMCISCKKENTSDSTYPCKAIVFDKAGCTNNDVYILKFISGFEKVKLMTYGESGQGRDSLYEVPNLPNELKIKGLSIKLDIRKPQANEIPGCYSFEMPMLYADAFVYVIKAIKE